MFLEKEQTAFARELVSFWEMRSLPHGIKVLEVGLGRQLGHLGQVAWDLALLSRVSHPRAFIIIT